MKTKNNLRQPKKSILTKMLVSMLLSLLLMFALLSGTIFFGGVTRQLRTNAFDIFGERVSGRRDNLNGEMLQRWTNLGESVQDINKQAARLVAKNSADYSDFTAASPLSRELIEAVSERLIYQLRRSTATGVFLILNGDDTGTEPTDAQIQQRAGLYIRDYDPDTSPADDSDLMLERAPMAFVKKHDITLDTYWQPIFTFDAEDNNSFFYKPYQAAQAAPGAEAENLGYWDVPSDEESDGSPVITYSLPLLAKDGRPYGVFGVEFTLDYVAKKLPYTEINGNVEGSYVLAKKNVGADEFQKILSTGPYFKNVFGSECETLGVSDAPVYGDCYEFFQESRDKVYGCIQYLELYNSNTPFENEQWALIGMIQDGNLLALYHSVILFLVLSLIIAFSIGVVSVALNSARLTRPIKQLAKKVRESDPNRPVLLGEINMSEIDELSASIETLSRSVAESYSTLSKIMELAGYRVGAFEYSPTGREVRYTDAFFRVLGLPLPTSDRGVLPIDEFKTLMQPISDCPSERQEGSEVYKLREGGRDVWVRIQVVENAEKTLGVVSDVTAEVLQRKQLEYERDYDSLTMLQNRRAFHAHVAELLDSGEVRIAAMIMMDLDNLKYMNDTYGHDVGDAYLRRTAEVLRRHTSENVLTARMSGDEFYVFILGTDRAEIEKHIADIRQELSTAHMKLPDGTVTRVRVSAGVAWYPKDSDAFSQLVRYADFAMYRVKHTTKGRFSDFNQDNYDRESFLLNNKEELNHLIDDSMVRYDFQAIVDARDGSVFAYEALMRPTSPLFPTPLDVLAMAHSQSKLYEIERLTIFKALEAFSARSSENAAEKLFLNSIPNQILSGADLALVESTYSAYLSRIVVELTEEEKPDAHLTRAKNSIIHDWHGQIALDDFGAGYNGEAALLSVSPDYIKIDKTIVRNLDRDGNRRQLVENIMDYARRYSISVIAEGVETGEELQTLLACGVHYLQGYYLAYPNGELLQVPENIRREICDFYLSDGNTSK
ncbi:MAG: EAL domain-containing protein [Oscillospiraceae bacterium]